METLSGPQFLAVYGAVCALLLVFATWFVRSKDGSADAALQATEKDLDPYEIAYLRGGANELVRYLVFELTRDGLLEVVPGSKKREPARIARTGVSPGASPNEVASVVYRYFETPHTAEELFRSSVPAQIDAAFESSRAALASRRLLADDNVRSASLAMRLGGSAVVLGLLAVRLWYALAMHHRNVILMCVMAGLTIIALLLLTKPPRLSKRGRRYLESLRAALPPSGEPAAVASPAFGLVVAAAGVAALAGTPYAALGDTFKQQLASGSTSSSGCGSGSSCGGGGCGGGCGG